MLRVWVGMGPCTHLVYTFDPKVPFRDYFKAEVYTIWVHAKP